MDSGWTQSHSLYHRYIDYIDYIDEERAVIRSRLHSVRTISAAAVLAISVAVATPLHSAEASGPGGIFPDPDAQVRINQLQTVGTHNSYHVENTPLEKELRDHYRAGTGHGSEQYTHPPVPIQLGLEKARQVELDVVRDDTGGRFANPILRRLTGAGPWYPRTMKRPGIKVLHEEDVDYRSNCLTFVDCLSAVKQWSDRHRGAIPITILLQFDDGNGPTFPPFTPQPLLPWTKTAMQQAEREVLSVFPRRQLITPDDVRQPGRTLHDSVTHGGWPTLRHARGKVMFGMDNDRATYVAGNPNLEDRLFFTNAQDAPEAPDGAFAIRDEADQLQATIRSLVRAGLMIRTRADTPQVQAQNGDTTRRDAAFASGSQLVSTDYPFRGSAARWGTDYYAALPGALVARCNPVNAPAFCRSAGLDHALLP